MRNLIECKPGPAMVLGISILAMILPLIVIENDVLQYTNDLFDYPLDDTYIHLSVAKNLTLNHVWGISSHEYTSASSSILYPLLLSAIFTITGVNVLVPLIINVVTGIIFIVIVRKWLEKQGLNATLQAAILILVIFLIPLPLVIMCGMEHTLHLLFTFLFLTTLGDLLESSHSNRRLHWRLYLYGFLITMIRFESIAFVVIACLILFFVRRWKSALVLCFWGMLPILSFSMYSLHMGSDPLPNSVLIKASGPTFTIDGLIYFFSTEIWKRLFVPEGGYNQMVVQRLLVILPLCYLLFLSKIRPRPSYHYILIILIVMTVTHLCFMMYSGWPRYEAYLVGCALIYCGAIVGKYGGEWLSQVKLWSVASFVGFVGIVLIAGPFFLRSWTSFNKASGAAISIHDQQYEMGRFVHLYYDEEPIAFNDIGAVSYLTHGKNLDLWGLGNLAVARSRRGHYNSADFLDSLCHKDSVKIAIVFEAPFRSLVQRWKKIATWDIPYNNSSYSDSVSFYAVEQGEVDKLAAHLKEYQAQLPGGVIVRYY